MKPKTLLLIVAFGILCQNCATIIGGGKDTTRVKQGTPPNARVYYNGEYVGIAPCGVRVRKVREQGLNKIEIKADGYETSTINMMSKISMGYLFLDIFSGVFPLILDFANGNIYKPRPNKIDYYLGKKEASGNTPAGGNAPIIININPTTSTPTPTPTPTTATKTLETKVEGKVETVTENKVVSATKPSIFVKGNFKVGEKVMWKGLDQKIYSGTIAGLFPEKAAVKYKGKKDVEKSTNVAYLKLAKTSGSVQPGFNVGDKVIWKGIDFKNKEGNIVGIFQDKAVVKYKNSKGEEKKIAVIYNKLAKTEN